MSEYPTKGELKKIEGFDFKRKSMSEFLDLVKSCWHWPDWGFSLKKHKLELHTGGWSGNESIIESLQKNILFWDFCWYKSVRGGHYYFEVKSVFGLRATERRK